MKQNQLHRVLIVGGGPSGMSMIRAIKQAQKQTNNKYVQFQCYEMQNDWMGQWNYNWKTGRSQQGYSISNSMYQGLWANLPKEINQYPDYTFKQHFKELQVSSFLPRAVWRRYVQSRFKKFNIKDHIQFNHVVRFLRYDQKTLKFYAQIHNLVNQTYFERQYDYAIIGSGHFSTPFMPYYKGFDKFNGKLCHSSQIRSWSEFTDKRVLIVGSSLSAQDSCLQLIKYNARSIAMSIHKTPFLYNFSEKVILKECLKQVFENKIVLFEDGSKQQFDCIILCTGFLYSFPFLDTNLKLKMKLRFYPPLYNTTVFVENSKLFFMGMQKQIFSFLGYDMQAKYIIKVIEKKISLPKKQQMIQSINQWMEQQDKSFGLEIINFIKKLSFAMNEMGNYRHPNLESANNVIKNLMQARFKSIQTYRDQVYDSVITKSKSINHPIKWIKNMDDTEQGYINTFKEIQNKGKQKIIKPKL